MKSGNRKRVYVRLDTNFEVDTGGGSLGIIDSLSTGLDVRAHAVIVAGGERGQVTQPVNCDGVIRSTKADGGRVPGKATLGDIVSGLSAEEEPIATEDGVGSERRSL